jgi:methylase of polypeptide subunit release factors
MIQVGKQSRAKARRFRRHGASISEISRRLSLPRREINEWVKSIKIEPDIEYLPAGEYLIDRMLDLCQIKPSDVLYELGCGDARICVRAAQRFGVHCLGIDVDPERLREARANVSANGVSHLITIRHGDFLNVDLRKATLAVMYINPEYICQIQPNFDKMLPGTRIVSINYPIQGVHFREYLAISPRDPTETASYVYYYVNPLVPAA